MIDKLDNDLLQAIFEAVPVEMSVIDANDEVAGWNKHEKRLFKRPINSIGLNVRDCHPQKSIHMVEQILQEMKAGTRDKARFWADIPVGPKGDRHKILIEYYALRTPGGKYLGCLECTQDIEEIQHLQGQQRLLDPPR